MVAVVFRRSGEVRDLVFGLLVQGVAVRQVHRRAGVAVCTIRG
uniref:Uncharacterized protein n=1 Tax=Siphoviridae sp. ctJyX12 TaxID=2827840 RepID=A0A8S5SQG2_9CAUD|nr:MAG TPA: hypothetical protein [Siphoviridae sp. ctJyX12]